MNGIFCFIDHPTEKHLLKFFLTFWTTVAPQSLSSDMVPIGISSSWTPSFVVIVRIYWAALITFSIPLERKYTRLISTWSSYCFALILWYWNHKDLFLSLVILCKIGVSGFFRLQGIKVLWGLQFLEYLRTLSFKFQKATSKIEVVLALPCWLSQFSWDSQQGRLRTTSILVRAFWNFKLKVLKYSRNCSLHNTLIPNLVKPLTYLYPLNKSL